jgi:hypothetical protein
MMKIASYELIEKHRLGLGLDLAHSWFRSRTMPGAAAGLSLVNSVSFGGCLI